MGQENRRLIFLKNDILNYMKKNTQGRNVKAMIPLPIKIKTDTKKELVLKNPPTQRSKNKHGR